MFSVHSKRIYEFILMLVIRRADADEVFQETCLVLWNKFDGLEANTPGGFYAWACKIAYLKILACVAQSSAGSIERRSFGHSCRKGDRRCGRAGATA